MIRFLCLGSGSSGNCYYLGTEEEGFLIDAGISQRISNRSLKEAGVITSNTHLKGILLTHEHADHVRAVGAFAHTYHLPIYASGKVVSAIKNSRYIREDLSGFTNVIECFKSFELAGFSVEAFPVPHDSIDNVGYYISKGDFHFTLATDIGHSTETIKKYVSKANYIVIEANYDREMLERGSYPQFLKDRVSGINGHLSNDETAELLAKSYHHNMKKIWLCHLSKENNHPDLCWKTIEYRLFQEGIRVGKDVELITLKRTTPSELYILE